jgi:4-carboxymuconolactone decarboxylase
VEALRPEVADLVSLSAAIAAGDGAAVARSAESALRAGAAPSAVYEALLQSYLFVGFPRAIEAFFAAGTVLARAGGAPRAGRGQEGGPPRGPGSDPSPDVPSADDLARWRRDGEALCRRVYGANYAKLLETMRGLSPDLARWMLLEGYGKTLSRPGLDAVAREYSVVAMLVVTRMWRQLRSHAIGAIHVGGTRAGVLAAIERCAPFADAATLEEARRIAERPENHASR